MLHKYFMIMQLILVIDVSSRYLSLFKVITISNALQELTSAQAITTINPATCNNPQAKDTIFFAVVFCSSILRDLTTCRAIGSMLTHDMTAISSLALILSEVNATIVKNDRPTTSKILDTTHCKHNINLVI